MKKFHEKGLKHVGVSMDHAAGKWLKAIKRIDLTLGSILNEKGVLEVMWLQIYLMLRSPDNVSID